MLARRLLHPDAEGSLRQYLVGGTLGTLALRITGSGLGFIVGVIVARTLGPKEFGVFAYAMAWANLLVFPVAAVLHTIVLRDTAAYHVRRRWSLMRGLLSWLTRVGLVFSIGLGVAIFTLVTILVGPRDPQVIPVLWLSLLLIPLVTLMRLRQGALQGLRYVVMGQLPENIVESGVFLVLLGAAAMVLGRQTVEAVVVFKVASALVALLVGTRLLTKVLPTEVKRAEPAYEARAWIASALPLLAFFAMNSINSRIDVLILGILRSSEEAGLYTVAFRGTDVLSFLYVAAYVVVSPTISRLYTTGQLDRLQRMMTLTVRWLFALSLPLGAALIFFGKWLLLLFGPGFVPAATALAILSVGRLVNIALGWNLNTLMMTGHQRDAALAMIVTVIVHLLLSVLLIPAWGLNGATIGTSLSIVLWNVLTTWQLRARLGLDSTIAGRPRRKLGVQAG